MEIIVGFFLFVFAGAVGLVVGVFAGPSVQVLMERHLPDAVLQPLRKFWLRGPVASPGASSALDELRKVAPDVARDLESAPAVPVDSLPPEVTVALTQQIDAAQTHEAKVHVAQRYFRDVDVAELVVVLSKWKPRRRQRGVDLIESEYEESLASYLQRSGYGDQVDFQRRVYWPRNRETAATRHAVPDMIFRGRVLLELKADMVRSDQADRAMGQMLRYLLAWRPEGAAILTVCGQVPPEIRFLVRHYIDYWRTKLGCPVTVMFRQDDDVSLVQTEFVREK
jgi:hypothetical protein